MGWDWQCGTEGGAAAACNMGVPRCELHGVPDVMDRNQLPADAPGKTARVPGSLPSTGETATELLARAWTSPSRGSRVGSEAAHGSFSLPLVTLLFREMGVGEGKENQGGHGGQDAGEVRLRSGTMSQATHTLSALCQVTPILSAPHLRPAGGSPATLPRDKLTQVTAKGACRLLPTLLSH